MVHMQVYAGTIKITIAIKLYLLSALQKEEMIQQDLTWLKIWQITFNYLFYDSLST